VEVRSIDERTTAWENEFPTYRVYFFDNPLGGRHMWTAYTYELTEAHNVQQVLAWADANARGRPYCVYAVIFSPDVRVEEDENVGLIQLSGWNPTSPASGRAHPPGDFAAEPERAA
jgi:hypothetical protein